LDECPTGSEVHVERALVVARRAHLVALAEQLVRVFKLARFVGRGRVGGLPSAFGSARSATRRRWTASIATSDPAYSSSASPEYGRRALANASTVGQRWSGSGWRARCSAIARPGPTQGAMSWIETTLSRTLLSGPGELPPSSQYRHAPRLQTVERSSSDSGAVRRSGAAKLQCNALEL